MYRMNIINGALYQWDVGRQLEVWVPKGSTVNEIHFKNPAAATAYVAPITDGIADIPNLLLQESGILTAYAVVSTSDSRQTLIEGTFEIIARQRPDDYVYTEEEVKVYEALRQRISNAEQSLEGLNMDLQGPDGRGGLYIVRATPDPDTYNIPRADRTQEEIRAAVAAGKTVLLVYSCVESAFVAANEGRVFTYAGEIVKDNGSTCPTFEGYLTYRKDDSDLLMYWKAYVKPGGTVGLQGDSLKTRTPHKLKLTGAVTAEFDGIEEVTVEIPQGGGVSDPGTAHLQLVSDENGKAVWVDRLAYPYTGQVDVLPETALTYMGEAEGMQMHVLMSPLIGVLKEGKTYQVNYNGVVYDCPIVSADEGMAFVLGKASTAGLEGGNEDAPFALIVYNDADTIAGQGFGAICLALDGATSVTISITGEGTVYKKLPEEYLPASAVRKPITLTVATDDTVTAVTDFNAAWAMGAQALMDAIVIKHERADGTRTITPDNVELSENDGGMRYIRIRFSEYKFDMEDEEHVADCSRWIFWTLTSLQLENDFIPGFNPNAIAKAKEGYYARYYGGNMLLELVSPSKMLEDLGFLTVTVTTDGSTYTADKTYDEVIAAVQAGKYVRAIMGEAILQCDGRYASDMSSNVLFHCLYKGVFHILTYTADGLTLEQKTLS